MALAKYGGWKAYLSPCQHFGRQIVVAVTTQFSISDCSIPSCGPDIACGVEAGMIASLKALIGYWLQNAVLRARGHALAFTLSVLRLSMQGNWLGFGLGLGYYRPCKDNMERLWPSWQVGVGAVSDADTVLPSSHLFCCLRAEGLESSRFSRPGVAHAVHSADRDRTGTSEPRSEAQNAQHCCRVL